MKSSLKNPTKAEKRRFYLIKFEIGCLIHPNTPAEAHHLLRNGKRVSHLATIPLCTECHTGGDSTHKRKVWFRETYGTDEELLAETNRRVEEFESRTFGRVA